jgi:hypothetical protein
MEPKPRPLSLPVQVLGLIVLALLAHSLSLRCGFIVDDFPLIVRNPLVTEGGHWREILTSDFFRNPEKAILWRPAVIASFAINRAVTGLSPAGFHAVNLLLHVLNALLVWAVLRRLLSEGVVAWLAAALFAFHPLLTEAVGCVFARTELLAALGQLAALLCWLNARTLARPRTREVWGAGFVVALSVALLSKESAVMLPGIIAAEGIIRRRSLREVTVWVGLAAAVIVVYLICRIALFGTVAANPQRQEILALINPAAVLPWPQRMLAGFSLLPFALFKFVWPLSLSLDYSFNQIPVALSVPLALRALLGLVLLWFAVREIAVSPARAKCDDPVRLGAAWFIVTWLLVSNILWPVSTIFAERLLYFPSIGLCLIAGWCGERIWRRLVPGHLVLGIGLGVALCGAGIFRAQRHHLDLISQRTALLATAEASPRSAKALADASGALLEEAQRSGDPSGFERAAQMARRAVEIHRAIPSAWLNLAVAEYHQRHVQEARQAAEEVMILTRPGDPAHRVAAEIRAAVSDQ